MMTALKTFISDLLSTIVFLAIFASTNNAPLAIGVSMAVGVLQVVVLKLRGRPVATMQWASMGLVIVFGSASLVTHDNRFIMIKPTIIAFAIGAVMLQKGWMDRYLPQIAHDNLPRSLIVGAGYAWSALIFTLGIANFIIATTYSFKVWAWFNAVVPVSAEIAAFFVQYATFRIVGRRRARRAAAGIRPTAPAE
jgi:intracellular septation protein